MNNNTETNNNRGYVLFHDSDGDGENDEILIMDNPDITKAVKVCKFSENGMEVSKTGYAGPFHKPDLEELLGANQFGGRDHEDSQS